MTASPTQGVLSRLHGVRPIGVRKWQALCPVHEDRHRSLFASEGGDGRRVLIAREVGSSTGHPAGSKHSARSAAR